MDEKSYDPSLSGRVVFRTMRRVPWERILERLGISYHRRSTGAIYVSCLFHEELTPSLKFWPSGTFHCFGCHAEGDVADFVARVHFKRVPRFRELVPFFRELAPELDL